MMRPVTQLAGILDELTTRYAALFTSGGDDDAGDGPTRAGPTAVLSWRTSARSPTPAG